MTDNKIQLSFSVDKPIILREAISLYGISKKALTSIKFDGGHLLVNGEEKTVRHTLEKGDVVTIIFPIEKKSEGLIAEDMYFPILFEDEHLLIISKKAGMSTIPSREHPKGTLANGIAGYLEKKSSASTVHIVTRLDKDTSGIVCIAKHRHAHHLMSKMQKVGTISRTYEAIVHGNVEQDSFIIDAPIGRKDSSIIERRIDPIGKPAKTLVEVIKRFTFNGEKLTHVRLKLYTGRTHQIRVHMMSIGHPLIGDDLYGGSLTIMSRQALHARQLKLIHPFTRQVLMVEDEYPLDMEVILKASMDN